MGEHPLKRAVFLDRDGVLNDVVMRDDKPASPRDIHELKVVEDAGDCVARLKDRGYLAIVVTNQPDLARGLLSQAEHNAITDTMKAQIPLDAVYVCPDDNHHDSDRKKPNPGMLLEAAKEHQIDLAASFMIGDSWKDVEAATRAGCHAILIDRPYNRDAATPNRVPSLAEAVNLILGQPET